MFAIAWQFLNGSYSASDFADREAVEWPPHPDRVFQALAAAWAERGENPEERAALEWLESLEPPSLSVPEVEAPGEPVRYFVPVNDAESSPAGWKKGDYSNSLLPILPDRRGKKERSFPRIYVGDQPCAMVWRTGDFLKHRESLEKLCAEVTRIGHSSSFVRCWLETDELPVSHEPSGNSRSLGPRLRIPTPGRLKVLSAVHLEAKRKKNYQGTPKAVQISYRTVHQSPDTVGSVFSPLLMIWRKVTGPPLGLEDTLAVTKAFRNILIPVSQPISQALREIISGHTSDGGVLRSHHLAFLPLAFSGSPYADGHIMGVALSLPASASPELEDQLFKACAAAADDKGQISLKMGSLGVMKLELADPFPIQKTLQNQTWTGPAFTWASITPLVLDRMQNSRRSDPDGWAIQQVKDMCGRAGLPEPKKVSVGQVSYCSGVPSVHGFPPLRRKDGSSRRMVHALCRFDQPVRGPVIIGSGRYRGYGLFKPVSQEGAKMW